MTTFERPSWDRYFLYIARAVSARADCTRKQVGAVLVDRQRRIRSTGYNGSPPGGPSCLLGECPRGASGRPAPQAPRETCVAVHAEANALLWADPPSCQGATMYVTYLPCSPCLRLMTGAGLARVVYSTFDSREEIKLTGSVVDSGYERREPQ